jgi:hypothetical protein
VHESGKVAQEIAKGSQERLQQRAAGEGAFSFCEEARVWES